MFTSSRESTRQLFEVAEAQGGFFTARQARMAGFDERNHPYHVRVGNWIREARGIYRLAHYPLTERADLVLWSLWSRDRHDIPQGVFSHDSALAIHDLSDWMPARLHMTVPSRFRRSGEIPGELVLHHADLASDAVEVRQGFRITRPLRTLLDLLADGRLPRDILRQALREALQRGLISVREVIADPSPALDRQALRDLYQELRRDSDS